MKKILVVLSIALISLAIGCLSEATEPPDPYVGRSIRNISTLVNSLAKTLDWCPENDLIAFERFGADGYVDTHVLNPENGQIRALTDGNPLCPQKNNGNSAWHPSGRYIVFTAEKPSNPLALRREAIPGSGYNCDLWLASADATAFYPLTDYPLYSRAVIHPHFSHDGNKLFWAERLGKSSGSGWGEWALKIADFATGANGPNLSNVQTYQPGQYHYFYESHCFNADDSRILYSANADGQSDSGFDIYEMNLITGETTNLTHTPNDWDEHAHYSPDGKHIAWMSATGLGINMTSIGDYAWEEQLITELWLMNSNGTDKQRLTHFNDDGYAESLGGKRAIVSDMTWSPDSRKLAVLVALPDSPEKSSVFLVELR